MQDVTKSVVCMHMMSTQLGCVHRWLIKYWLVLVVSSCMLYSLNYSFFFSVFSFQFQFFHHAYSSILSCIDGIIVVIRCRVSSQSELALRASPCLCLAPCVRARHLRRAALFFPDTTFLPGFLRPTLYGSRRCSWRGPPRIVIFVRAKKSHFSARALLAAERCKG